MSQIIGKSTQFESYQYLGENCLNVTTMYLDSIGKYEVILSFEPDSEIWQTFSFCPLKFFHKCEDGLLSIKIRGEIKSKTNDSIHSNELKQLKQKLSNQLENKKIDLNFKIFFSKSMKVCFKTCEINVSKNFEFIRFYYKVTQSLIDKESFLDKMKLFTIFDVLKYQFTEDQQINLKFDIKDDLESNFSTFFSLYDIENDNHSKKSNQLFLNKLICLTCNNTIVKLSEISRKKCIYNLNYDYISSMEILSCHESHTEKIIPDLNRKVRSL
jgi:hypothetical protein